jgi:hypothetical protein
LTFSCGKVVASEAKLTRVPTHNDMFENHLSQYAAMQKSFHRHESMPQDLSFGSSRQNFSHWGKKREGSEEFIFYFAPVASFNGRFVPDNLHLLCCWWPCGGRKGRWGSRRVKITCQPEQKRAASPVIHAHALTFRAVKHR